MFLFAFFELFFFWQYFLIISSILSMIFGCFGALKQQKLKRLMAYASINQIGYIFMGLCCGTIEGIQSALIYLILYVIMLIIFFGLLLNIQSSCFTGTILYISELNFLYRNDPACALTLFIVLLSMAGIPPLGGFLGKYYLFLATIHSSLYLLTFIGLIVSVISIFYYLRLIRSAIFENPKTVKFVAFNKNGFTMVIIGLLTVYLVC
jgi:NADH-quinone oxidoreductase subunit N